MCAIAKKMKRAFFSLMVLLIISCFLPAFQVSAFAVEPGLPTGKSALEMQAGSNIASAQKVELNAWTSNRLSAQRDEHWYRIELPSAGRLDLKFKGDYSPNGSWYLSLRDANDEELWSGEHEASGNLEGRVVTLHTTGLPAGVYYIQVRGPWSDSLLNKEYSLTPEFSPSDAWETELNDTVVTYDDIPLDASVSGTMRCQSDEDWYRITMPMYGELKISFSGQYAPSGCWYLSLRNADNEELWNGEYEGTTNNAKTLYVQKINAGTYYIQVRSPWTDSLLNKEYSLTPTYNAAGTSATNYVDSTFITSLSRAKKAFSVSWSKVSGASKYQVRYSTKSSMKGAKTVNVSKKLNAKKIKKLKAKKRYYVQVRVVKTIAGKTCYSAWSSKQSVVTK